MNVHTLLIWSKRADVLSAIGAFGVGLGVGLYVPEARPGLASVAVLIGLVCHGLGMLLKRRGEQLAGTQVPLWWQLAYWLCLAVIMLALLAYASQLHGLV